MSDPRTESLARRKGRRPDHARTLARVFLRLLSAFLVLNILGVFAWFERVPLLRTTVDLWTVSDEVRPADAVAVFGGGLQTRPFAAAEYYRDGLVPKVLVSNVPVQPIIRDIVHSETEQNRQVLIKKGVPAEAIELFGNGLRSTYEETIALRDWGLHNHAHTIIVPTEYFSSRRVRWILRHEFFGTGLEVLVPALDDPQYPRRAWWTDNKAILDFQNELIKYVFYRIRY